MAIPGFQSIMLPLLKIASDESDHNHTEVRNSLAAQFEISDREKKEMLPSGKQARFSNRVAWAIVYLRRAGLIENSNRGIFHITGQGLELLKTNPTKIDIKLLKQLSLEVKNWSKPSDQSIDIYRFFKDRDEAKWAFDLLRETLDNLGIKGPNDERFAVTCPSGGKALHLNFGQWLVLGFNNQYVGENRIEIALLADQADFCNKYESFDFAKGEDNFNIKIYKLPIELVKPLGGDLRIVYKKSLEKITDKFGDWKATPWRKNHHINEIAEALFDDKKLGDLLNPGFQRNIWWVNQGDSIKNECKDGVLCAPARADSSRLIPHWERLMEIKPEDIILHYANGELLYVSMSTAAAVTENRPYGRFDKVNLVKVDYYELIPSIPLSRFSDELQALLIKDGPLNVNGGVKEGYLWRLNPEALKIIQSSQPDTKWPEFAILDSDSSWIFQANPDNFDIDAAIGELKEITWKVNRYKDRVHAGDIVYLWKSGENAGIVAVGRILSEPALLKDLDIEKRFIRPKASGENGDKEFIGVRISIERVLGLMIRRQDLLNDPLLGSMQILRQSQGTNFVLSDKEAKAIHDLIYSSNSEPKNPEYTLDVNGNLKFLNSGKVKFLTCKFLRSILRSCVDANPEGVPHVERFVQRRFKHQRDCSANRS